MSILRTNRAIIIAFMIGTFSIGMTEYVITGLVTQLSNDLNVPVSLTGLLLSVYAISVAVFGPIFRITTMKFPVKPVLISCMAVFVLSNALAAMATSFTVLVVARLISAAIHAPFFGLSLAMAHHIVAPSKRGQAIAAVQGGLTISIMLGVPFGSFLGGMLEWRIVFWMIAVLGLITLIGLVLTLPNEKPTEIPKVKNELGVFKEKTFLMTLAIVILGYSGVFTTYVFKEPILREIGGVDVVGVTFALFAFGTGAVAGNFLSSRIPLHHLTSRLRIAFLLLTLILIFFIPMISVIGTLFVASFLLGMFAFGTVPLLNAKLLITGQHAPSLAGTIAAAAFNLANALGATLGTIVLNAGVTFFVLTLCGAALSVIGILLTILLHRMESREAAESSGAA
ncbi:Predicted arabinose efflux permease, MFS family [Marinococcus luteus]|uniref:Predicted arabinose efflux permease, MFS family n=1 Tax=Marinococcus luteus TaxID=1122204 RepID=A0A1H2V8B3_9BACI|nr:MFS transporter [Marinococcus luteus]SDW64154.1 Predicted arabinose efflux permease, MFS family [Marinococcus luteus]